MAALPAHTTAEPYTGTRLTTTTATAYATVLTRFRTLVPPVSKGLLAQRNRADFEATVMANLGPHGFTLFHEFDHSNWIKMYPSASSTAGGPGGANGGRALQRFIFGNPLIAITMISEDVEAGLNVPIELLLVETEEGGARCVTQLPSGLIAGHEQGVTNEALVQAVGVLDGKLMDLIGDMMK